MSNSLKVWRVECHQNNSGGSFWLSPAQFDALLADGWKVVESSREWREKFEGTHACDIFLDLPARPGDTEAGAVDMAKVLFRNVTGQDPDAEGCNCCGAPFWFNAEQVDAPIKRATITI